MNRRWIWIAFALIAIAGFTWFFYRPSDRRINVLLITLDTTRADHIGAYGHSQALTPTIDSLAQRGTLFANAFAPAPLTLPSHATIMTGLYPPEHGIRANGENSLDSQIPTLASILQAAGYETGGFVSSFVLAEKFGLNRGFNTYSARVSGEQDSSGHYHRQCSGVEVTDQTLAWLKQSAKSPFFCWVHYYDPHHPYLPHRDLFGERFKSQPYDAEIAYVDNQIARLVNFVNQRGLAKRTLIVVVGDHGESLGEHDEPTHAYTVYNSTIHVPLIFCGPGAASTHRVRQNVSLVDLFPTIVDILDVKPLTQSSLSRSLKPALQQQDLESRACYAETEQPWREGGWSPLQAVIHNDWKFIRTPIPELYEIANDRAELTNRIAESADRAQEMEAILAELEEKMLVRQAPAATLSQAEQQTLQSLGYVAGTNSRTAPNQAEALPDIKEMLPCLKENERALYLINHKDYAGAEAILTKTVARSPHYAKAQCNLGLSLAAQSKYDQAEPHFQQALSDEPNSERLHQIIGITRINQNRLDDAKSHFETAFKIAPTSVFALLHLGDIAQRQGQFDQARNYYQSAIRINPEFKPAQDALKALARAR